MEKQIWTIDDIKKDYDNTGLSGRRRQDYLDYISKKAKAFNILKRCGIDVDYEDGKDDEFIVGTRRYVKITREEKKLIEEVL